MSKVAKSSAGAAVALAALIAGLSGCGSSSNGDANTKGVPSGSSKVSSAAYSGFAAKPAKPAPPLTLKDSLGKTVDISQYKGKAVLVTFIYTHCPDICPLIVSHLHTAQALLGPNARNLQIVAVSTDPRGDNPSTVAAFLRKHRMTGRMQYLIGSRAQLGNVWKAWNIVAKPAKSGRDLVEHSALIYGIDAQGRITTLYPANFKPAQIVHDVPLLAQS
jgi:protein SCO1